MSRVSNRTDPILWVLVSKGWFFGMMAISLPLMLLIAISLPFVESESTVFEFMFMLVFIPLILVVQGLLIALVVSFGLWVARLLGI